MVPDIKIKFSLDGNEHTLDYKRVPFNAWSELKQIAQFTPATLLTALGQWDMDAITALVWLDRKQVSRRAKFAETQQELAKGDHNFELSDVIVDGVSQMGEDVEAGEPDPTVGSS